tara:strand:+ start:3675 stop:4772 length:1098 start_codon:yes stop_codon:yes gene_type:complete
MATKALEMEGVETLELPDNMEGEEETTATATADEPSPEAAEPDEPTSFVDAMAKAMTEESDEPEAKPEAKPEPEAEPAADTKESRSANDFKKVKAERDDARTKMDELEAKLKELSNSDVDELLKAAQTERDDLSERLKLAAIERHPKFQKEFQNRLNGIIDRSKKLVGAENAERIAELLSMGDSDYRSNGLEEIMLELTTTKQAQLGAMLASIEEVRDERSNALTNANETYQRMVADEASQREAALEQTNQVFDKVAKEASNLELFHPREEDDDWNREVNERLETARNIFSGDNDAEDLARASMWAAAGPKYREITGQLLEINRRLREQIKGQGGANPTVASSGDNTNAEPKTFLDHMDELMQGE